jgi:hypothetical protein
MGQVMSRTRIATNVNQPRIEPTDLFRATGTYFGPNFILESNGVSPGANSQRAFFEDIINVLSTSQTTSDTQQLQAFGDIYSQLPPAELKTCLTIQSKVNVQKSTITLSKIKESSSLSYKLSFRFDLLEPASISIYWGAKEKMITNQHGTSYKYIDKEGNPAKEWKFGPFPAGLNQTFDLPEDYTIDQALLRSADMEWVTQLEIQPRSTLNTPASPTGNQPEIPLDDPTASIEKAQPASSPPVETVTIQMEPNIKNSAPIEPSMYHLIVLMQLDTAANPLKVDSQSTFVNFGPSNEQKLVVQFMKQLIIIDGLSYVLQEIYGFTEVDIDTASNYC